MKAEKTQPTRLQAAAPLPSQNSLNCNSATRPIKNFTYLQHLSYQVYVDITLSNRTNQSSTVDYFSSLVQKEISFVINLNSKIVLLNPVFKKKKNPRFFSMNLYILKF